MNLELQILTFVVSFLFGVFFGIELKLNYKFIYQSNKIYKIITTFFFIMTNVLIYFIILRKTNNGILHIYGVLAIILGFILEHFVEKHLINIFAKIFKKWYNSCYRVGVWYGKKKDV